MWPIILEAMMVCTSELTSGIFYRNADMSDWIYFSNGLPSTRIEDIKVTGSYVYAGTYGRSIWRSLHYTPCPVSIVLTPANDPSSPYSTGTQHYETSHSINSTRILYGGAGTDVRYSAGYEITLEPGFEASIFNRFEATLDGCHE